MHYFYGDKSIVDYRDERYGQEQNNLGSLLEI